MPDLSLDSIQPWTPHTLAAPLTKQNKESLVISAGGTRTCVGGWQLTYSGAKAGLSYLVRIEVEHRDLDCVRDSLRCMAYWEKLDPHWEIVSWDYLLPNRSGDSSLRFQRCFTAPDGADRLILRYTFRWSAKGESTWRLPDIESVPTPKSPDPARIAVVTGRTGSRNTAYTRIQDNLNFYVPLCEAACRERPDLIVLPEIALQFGIKASPLDLAVPAPGPETEVFSDLARRHNVRIVLGMLERDGDAVHNSAVLIAPNGVIDGKYRKVHLAEHNEIKRSEIDSGILPGSGFPVFETEIGRIGCNICMDGSVAESSRMVGLAGADFLILPIMGDHRAHHAKGWAFDPDRFKSIMRTRAMDNQLCMVVAVNSRAGSCIIDRVGNVLAWNDGDDDYVLATVKRNDGYREKRNGCYRAINWMQRRPHVYRTFGDEENTGSLGLNAN